MTTIINEFKYDEDKIKEATKVSIIHRVKKDVMSSIFACVILIILSFVFDYSILLFLGIFLPVIEIIIIIYKIKVATKNEMEQFSKVNSNFKVTLKEKIFVQFDNKKHKFEYNQIESYLITANLILLNFSGYGSVVLSKDGFVSGTYEDLMKLLDEKKA